MSNLSKIRTINSRIRRKGSDDYATRALLHRANKIGFTTKGGYISKSKNAQSSALLEELIQEYESDRFEQEMMGEEYIINEMTVEGLLEQYVTPSDYFQILHDSNSVDDAIDTIIDYIEQFETFADDERKQEFENWLRNDYANDGKNAEKVFNPNEYHSKKGV